MDALTGGPTTTAEPTTTTGTTTTDTTTGGMDTTDTGEPMKTLPACDANDATLIACYEFDALRIAAETKLVVPVLVEGARARSM